jgi:hypothetical protein
MTDEQLKQKIISMYRLEDNQVYVQSWSEDSCYRVRLFLPDNDNPICTIETAWHDKGSYSIVMHGFRRTADELMDYERPLKAAVWVCDYLNGVGV